MTKMNKKGQGAMEYLMTYGWAILVVMIVGIVLWQMGIFTGGGNINRATGFIRDVGLLDTSIKCDTNGNVSFILTNQAGVTLRDVEVQATGSCNGISAPINLTSGDRASVTISNCTPTTIGSRWTIGTTTTFTKNIAGQDTSRTQTGQILCTVEQA